MLEQSPLQPKFHSRSVSGIELGWPSNKTLTAEILKRITSKWILTRMSFITPDQCFLFNSNPSSLKKWGGLLEPEHALIEESHWMNNASSGSEKPLHFFNEEGFELNRKHWSGVLKPIRVRIHLLVIRFKIYLRSSLLRTSAIRHRHAIKNL